MFEVLLVLTAAVIVAGTVWGVVAANDTLHPLVYLLPMSGFFYVYLPISLYSDGTLLSYFSYDDVIYVQGLNLACVLGLALGGYKGTGGLRRDPDRTDVFSFISTPEVRRTVLRLGIGLGVIGLGAYIYQIVNVGGFVAAYDTPKGGGWAASGYIRNLDMFVIPAIVLIYMSQGDKRLPLRHRVLLGLFSMPLLLHGLLSARRTPTFLALSTLIGGWYLARRKRPILPTVAVGGTAIGILLLVLVTFRGEIYLGSSFLTGGGPSATEVIEESLEQGARTDFTNEYLYGTYVVLNSRDEAGYYWGRRYLTQLFVRPIPSALWPNKYADVGMEAMTHNAGQLRTANPEDHPQIPPGAAPVFAGSAYVELAWGAPLFVFFIGWAYALVWRRTLLRGGLWTVLYTIIMGLSIIFVAQSFIGILFRFLLLGAPVVVFWQWMMAPHRPILARRWAELAASQS